LSLNWKNLQKLINIGDAVEVVVGARGVRNGKIASIPEEYQKVQSRLSPSALVERMWSIAQKYCTKVLLENKVNHCGKQSPSAKFNQ
jgi:hypothetical protein